MADSKITALTSISTSTDPANDPLVIVDVSDTSMAATGTTKKVTLNQLLGASGTATLASATITGAATVGTTLGVTGVSTFSAGTALLPALTTTGDTNTGIYYPAADTFAVTTGGTERYRVDSAGNCGIGVTPSAWGGGFRYVQAGPGCAYGTNGSVDRTDVAANWYYNGGDKYINATGKASIFQQSGGAFFWLSTNTASGGAGSAMSLNTNMTLDASGNLLLGTPTLISNAKYSSLFNGNATYGIELKTTAPSGTSYFVNFFNSSTVQMGAITGTGTTVSYVTSSDYRLKEDVKPLTGALNRVACLKPSVYKWKADGSSGEGFLAHELAEVVPLAVNGEKDAVNEDGSVKPQGVDYSKVVPVLVAAIQELTARVQTLETR